MLNLKTDIGNVIRWTKAVRRKTKSLVEAGDPANLLEFMSDMASVENAYEVAIRVFPDSTIKVMPKFGWQWFSWVSKNIFWLLPVFGAALDGRDFLADARDLAKAMATKWGFASEVYLIKGQNF